MKAMLKLLAVGAAAILASSAAHAQDAPASAGPPPGAGLTAENPSVRNGGDTMDRDTAMLRDQAIQEQQRKAREGSKGTPRSVAALPSEVTVGSEIHDPRGALIGTVDSVDMANAVVKTSIGRVAVPLEAFGKDSKGLMLAMKKDDFDAQVAAANKPAAPAH